MTERAKVKLNPIQLPEDHPLVSVRVAAEMIGVCEMTIRRRIRKRQFPALRTGRKSMIPRSFIERLLAQAEAGQTVIVDEEAGCWASTIGAGGMAEQVGGRK
jgi:excisionase family DNA binding protein